MKAIWAAATDIVILIVICLVAIVMEAILLPAFTSFEIFELFAGSTVILVPLIYFYTFDLIVKGNTIGNKLFSVQYVIINYKRYKLLHTPLKMIAIVLWPVSLWEILSKKSLPYFDYFGMTYTAVDYETEIDELSFELVTKRTIAGAIDYIVVLIIGPIGKTILLSAYAPKYADDTLVGCLIVIVTFAIYQTIFDYVMEGRTFGKQLMRIELDKTRIKREAKSRFLFLHGFFKLIASCIFFVSLPYAIKNGRFPYDKFIGIIIVRSSREFGS